MYSSRFATWSALLSWLSLPLSSAYNPPIVKISNGTILGSTSGDVDSFLGIPFAQPPIGELRFRPSLAINTSFGSINATGTPRACPQLKNNYDPQIISEIPASDMAPYLSFFYPPAIVGEDCLTLNIQRPSTAMSSSKLPVLFWIYGGAFNTGSTQSNDFANFVTASVSLGHPILVVQANYRISAFGFLGGSEVQFEGSTNVGLRDQRLALKWVADNIAAFGGDADKVTIWGESAGAVSVLYQMLAEGGDNKYNGKPLFRAAMMDSGSSISAEPIDSDGPQGIFDAIVEASGCSESSHGDEASLDRLTCLRKLSYDDLINATNVAPSLLTYNGIALTFAPRPDQNDTFFAMSPERAIQAEKIARVPVITGNQADEGTLFSIAFYNGTTTNTLINKHLRFFYPNTPRYKLKHLIDTYSEDPAAGSPYGTFDDNQLYTDFKRNSALIGDTLFIFQRRYQLEHTADSMPAWSFSAIYNQSAGTLGTGHGTDLIMLASGYPAVADKHMLQYYISFINYLDPNLIVGKNGSRLTLWPRWTREEKQMIQFDTDHELVIRDDFREESYLYFKNIISELKV